MSKPRPPAIAPEGGCARLSCCIPFCRRTFRFDKTLTPWPPGSIVMCGKHWRTASNGFRRIDRRLRRLKRKAEQRLPPDLALVAYLSRRINDNWDRARKEITERAAGIA
jgi:hypothetical protein